MDFSALLRSEIANKRKAVEAVAGPQAKYVRRADLEAKREREYLETQRKLEEARAAKEAARAEQLRLRASPSPAPSDTIEKRAGSEGPAAAGDGVPAAIDSKEVIRRLRKLGEPIRLFGETDEERIERLRHLETLKHDDREGSGNEYQKTVSRLDHDIDLQELRKKEAAAERLAAGAEGSPEPPMPAKRRTLEELRISEDMIRTNRDELQARLYDYFRYLLEDQGEMLLARPEEVKRSQQGKLDSATYEQTKTNLKPFFKMLRRREMAPDMLNSIAKIAHRMQEREYILANDEYYLLSIGNAAWPIGVTMVGIHARSAREKIQSNQVAHVLNDEKTRKWIQGIKRLLTYAEQRYPPADLSKAVAFTRNSATVVPADKTL